MRFCVGPQRALKWIFAVPNGGHRAKSVAGKMKAEGAKAGVPDLSAADRDRRLSGHVPRDEEAMDGSGPESA